MAKQRLSMIEAQQAARTFVTQHVERVPLGLPTDLTNEQFAVCMNAIVRAMVEAWGAGYYHHEGGGR